MTTCFHCKKELETDVRPGRGDSCPHCGSDVKVCLNCRFYDAASYNECREPSAERVVEKDRANFCDYFEFRGAGNKGAAPEDPLQKLKGLFKE